MSSKFLTKPELRRITGSNNAEQQTRILSDRFGIVAFGDGSPVVYREAMITAQVNRSDSSADINLDALDA